MAKYPLPNSFLLFSVFGLIATGVLWDAGKISPTWGFTMLIFFGICLISALVSVAPGEPKPYKKKK